MSDQHTPPDESDLVSQALRHPLRLNALTLAGWDALVRQSRRAGLLGRIACVLDAQGSIDAVPHAPRQHLLAAITLTEAQHAGAMREIAHIGRAIAPTGVAPVLLKGSAYIAGALIPALGRSSDHVDILVPRARLADVEAALMAEGWATTHHSRYEQRYYRQWLQELPPLRHTRRHTKLTVHHAIAPPTSSMKTVADVLLDSAIALPNRPGFSMLCPTDMALHIMVYLFNNGDLSRSLRDLSDLDLLLRGFGKDRSFWPALLERAVILDVGRPLHYGLHYAHRQLCTPIPTDTLNAAARHRPGWPLSHLIDALWLRALRPQHSISSDGWSPLARNALYLRALWVRMPPSLLLRHLTAKSLRLHEDRPAA
jgi:hypothetical protein